jgi:hypothetical protein
MKGIKLFGKIVDNELSKIKIDKNAELIYYMYDDNYDLIGIDKAIASSILISFKDNCVFTLNSLILSNSSPKKSNLIPWLV